MKDILGSLKNLMDKRKFSFRGGSAWGRKRLKGNNKLPIGKIMAFIFAAVLTLSIFFEGERTRETCVVLRATHNIEAGTLVKAEDFKEVEVGSYGLPSGLIADKKSLEGKVASVDILPGDNLSIEKFTGREKEVPAPKDGKVMISFTLENFAAGVAAYPEPGDFVSISPGALERLEVAAVHNEEGLTKAEMLVSSKSGNISYSSYAFLPKVVTVFADSDQVNEIRKVEQAGGIHLALIEKGKKGASRSADHGYN